MTRDEAIAEVHRGLGFRNDQTDNIIKCLVKAQTELELGQSLPSFIISEDEEIPLTSASSSFTLPTNFIREIDDRGANDFYTSDLSHLVKIDYDRGYAMFNNAPSQEAPTHYSLRKNSLYFWPAVFGDITLYWSYYARQASLLTSTSNAWLDNVPYLLISMAGETLASDLRDKDATAKFAFEKQKWWKLYMNDITVRDEANQPRSLGEAL